MRINFEDSSYIEIKKSDNSDNIVIIIQAKDSINSLKKITNAVEVTKEQLESLIEGL